MKRQKTTTFSSEMYQKALQEIGVLKWQLSLREAAWAAAEEVDKQKSERIHELESWIKQAYKEGYQDAQDDESEGFDDDWMVSVAKMIFDEKLEDK